MVDQRARVLLAPLVLVLPQYGDERLGECAFGEHAAEQVGQLEGNEKRVGCQSGAKCASDDEIANKAENS
ncbi:hypothetical protein SDC9_89191 [bioreactor metagenome]|uniref:Uncharacterized protein n=1 Tax=bioreactor metagenome TaxID=1076179 RepID=A0A644ZP44_9ZZZZ